jgi:AcrR family transcriptional regulator
MLSRRLNIPKNNLEKPIRSAVKNPQLIQERRNQIFKAAVALYKKKGYHLTGLRELSKKSHISLGNLYNYITTKQDILSIIHQKTASKVIETIDAKTSKVKDPVAMLSEMIDIELLAIDKHEDLIMLLYQEGHAMSKKSIHSMLSEEEKQIERFQHVLLDGMAKGVFRPCNPVILSNVIKMMVDTWVLKRWSLRGKVNIKEMKKSIIDLVLYGIVKE